ncbi:mechanosensitive ion channel family protein [Lutibacter holmesii]|uniref:Mechanosensitive ion channel family protein n=1 Tax=Lutibacter holmesii TaxID=1137985 RepID=A0ABW3WL36_9FLAO
MFLKKCLLALCLIPTILFAFVEHQNTEVYPLISLQQESEMVSAPVVFNLDTLFYINNSANSYPVTFRANGISDRLQKFTKNYNAITDSVYIQSNNNFIETYFNDKLLFITSNIDLENSDLSLIELAKSRTKSVQKSLDKLVNLTPKEWLIRIGYFTLSLVFLIAFIKLVNWLFRKLNVPLSKIEKNFLRKNRNILRYFIPKSTANIFVFISNIVRIVIIGVALFVYAPFMFSFFPWAEHLVKLFYGYIATPVKFVVFGFIDFIPSLFFILVIALFARYVVRVIKEISADIEIGKFEIRNFHKDWAKPTGNILSIFIYAFSLVLIFPYLPGSGSSAFQGVSIFIGAIISFGSTSAIANIIAGIVITYMRPFQIGDRVRIDSIVGDVIEKSILVTRIRTPKNEDVTIPNANILVGTIINYSNNEGRSIIVHTTITLGYDLPWQKVHKLLIEAANKTTFVEKTPEPFILQKSLDDYYVSYELNAHTFESKKIPFIYSEIHKNILDIFNDAGIEILSPAYMAARDGSLTTVPSKLKSEDKTPLDKIVDHLTGRNQQVKVEKSNDD